MKKIFSLLWIIFAMGSLFSESTMYQNLLNKLNTQNKTIQMQSAESNIEARNILDEKYKWLPKFELQNSAGFLGAIKDKSTTLYKINGTAVISQRFLMGSSLQLFSNNAFDIIQREETLYNYNFSAGAAFNMPMYAFAPSLFTAAFLSDFYSTKEASRALQLQHSITQKEIMSQAIFLLGSQVLQKKKLTNDSEIIMALDQERKALQIMWEQGKLSTFELNKKLQEHEKQKDSFIIDTMYAETIALQLKGMELSEEDCPKDLNKWLTDWETMLENVSLTNIPAIELQQLQLNTQWHNLVNASVQQIPTLFVSCNFEHIDSEDKYKTDILSTIKEPMQKNADYRWNVSLGLNINFAPFTDAAHLDKNFIDKRIIYETQKQILEEQYAQNVQQAQSKLTALDALIKNKMETEKLNTEQLEYFDILKANGKMSEYDYILQKHFIEQAKLDTFQARLDRICYLILFY